jgi:hypothetical protein
MYSDIEKDLAPRELNYHPMSREFLLATEHLCLLYGRKIMGDCFKSINFRKQHSYHLTEHGPYISHDGKIFTWCINGFESPKKENK